MCKGVKNFKIHLFQKIQKYFPKSKLDILKCPNFKKGVSDPEKREL